LLDAMLVIDEKMRNIEFWVSFAVKERTLSRVLGVLVRSDFYESYCEKIGK
jgi:hypothetical protein